MLNGAQFILIPTYGSKNKAQNKAVISRSRENGIPIIQANVGMNLIVNKGEITAYKWGKNKITTAFIDIPVKPSEDAVRACEKEFLKCQRKMQINWYRMIVLRLKRNKPTKDEQSHFIPDELFRKLQKSKWGEHLIKWKPED